MTGRERGRQRLSSSEDVLEGHERAANRRLLRSAACIYTWAALFAVIGAVVARGAEPLLAGAAGALPPLIVFGILGYLVRLGARTALRVALGMVVAQMAFFFFATLWVWTGVLPDLPSDYQVAAGLFPCHTYLAAAVCVVILLGVVQGFPAIDDLERIDRQLGRELLLGSAYQESLSNAHHRMVIAMCSLSGLAHLIYLASNVDYFSYLLNQ